MYDHILLATDGTVASTNAESHAIDLAAAHAATLSVVFVVDESVYSAYSGDEYLDEAEDPEHGLEEVGEATLARVREAASDAGVAVETELARGEPAAAIVAYGDEQDVDLVVLGTKRRPAEYRSLLGSVTGRVLRLTSRPATVVKTAVEE
jgi:nucleotide-binding universal stress UspA family protein